MITLRQLREKGPCWDTHKQVGMKKKNGKMVPNCVPKEGSGTGKKRRLYKDENPKDTVSIRSADLADAKGTVEKVNKNSKPHNRKKEVEEVAANSVAGGGVDLTPGIRKKDDRLKYSIGRMFRRNNGVK